MLLHCETDSAHFQHTIALGVVAGEAEVEILAAVLSKCTKVHDNRQLGRRAGALEQVVVAIHHLSICKRRCGGKVGIHRHGNLSITVFRIPHTIGIFDGVEQDAHALIVHDELLHRVGVVLCHDGGSLYIVQIALHQRDNGGIAHGDVLHNGGCNGVAVTVAHIGCIGGNIS